MIEIGFWTVSIGNKKSKPYPFLKIFWSFLCKSIPIKTLYWIVLSVMAL